VIWWSALLAFIVNIPPKANKGLVDQKEKDKIVNGMYNEMGIKRGELKYRIGLAAYLIGGISGWIMFYGKVVAITLNKNL